jgi:hypothetical protein
MKMKKVRRLRNRPGFNHRSLTDYTRFVAGKITVAQQVGFAVDRSTFHPSAFPHQADAVQWALEKGRGLIAMSFGLGKTQQQIEIARAVHAHTGRPFLIVCPLGVKYQFQVKDGPRLGVSWTYVRTDAEVRAAVAAGQMYLITN